VLRYRGLVSAPVTAQATFTSSTFESTRSRQRDLPERAFTGLHPERQELLLAGAEQHAHVLAAELVLVVLRGPRHHHAADVDGTPSAWADTRPYFLWWTDMTVGDLRRMLGSENLEERAYWMGARRMMTLGAFLDLAAVVVLASYSYLYVAWLSPG